MCRIHDAFGQVEEQEPPTLVAPVAVLVYEIKQQVAFSSSLILVMALTSLVRVLLCSAVFMPSLAQNLKGSIAEASVPKDASQVSQDAVQKYEAGS